MPRIAPLEDVLAAGEFGVKAGADLEQARNPALDCDAPLGRLGDAREDLQQCALAGAVAADDADHLAALDLEAHILERPELLGLSPATMRRPRRSSQCAAPSSARSRAMTSRNAM